MKAHYAALRARLDGDLFLDVSSRRLYANDASVYQQLPAAVVRPRHEEDCAEIVKFCAEHKLSLIPRTAGTSVAGQCVGEGIVVDLSRYMTNILEIDTARQEAVVQPGVILEQLNREISSAGLMFAPDTSTANRCMIGGMIGNNSCGAYSILYGTTREHVLEMDVVLSDGSVVTFTDVCEEALEEKSRQSTLEGNIYRCFNRILSTGDKAIRHAFPKADVVRRNTGYALDDLLHSAPWSQHGKPFNLSSLICGSEGTLALVIRARLRLVPCPAAKGVVCSHFATVDEALKANEKLLELKPAAIELMDRKIIDSAAANAEQSKNTFWLQGRPEAVLVTELFADNAQELELKKAQAISALENEALGYAHVALTEKEAVAVWSVRRAGLGLLMGDQGRKKAVAVIEDAAVAPADLRSYARDVERLLSELGVECVYYGHASVGLLHLRPKLDLADEHDRTLFKLIAEKFVQLSRKYGGSLSGEHGDGRVRSPYLSSFFGEEAFALLQEVKAAFDPFGIFNPHKIVDALPVDDHLRAGNEPADEIEAVRYAYGIADKCNGAGVCRRVAPESVMCPSYMVTSEEKYSPRGRMNLIRQALENGSESAWEDTDVKEALDTCLACKACASECPASVDVSKVKSEFLHQHRQRKGSSTIDMLCRWHGILLRGGTIFPRLANTVFHSPLMRQLGVSRPDDLPDVGASFTRVWNRNCFNGPGLKEVILLCDPFTASFEQDVLLSTGKLLKALGFRSLPLYPKSSLRLLISQGFKKEAAAVLASLLKRADALPDVPVICVEPSELSVFREQVDALDSLGLEKAEPFRQRVSSLEEFLLKLLDEGRVDGVFKKDLPRVYVHRHCHQKSSGDKSPIFLLERLGFSVEELKTGCCGKAGMFGYLYPELSERIANLSLVPSVRSMGEEGVLLATGHSCRAQIQGLTKREGMSLGHLLLQCVEK